MSLLQAHWCFSCVAVMATVPAEGYSGQVVAEGDITVRQMQEDDIPELVRWTMQEHWHVSHNIIRANYLIDPGGWFAACNRNDQLIGKYHEILSPAMGQ